MPRGNQTLRYNGTPKIDALVNGMVYPHWSHGPKMKKACTLGHYQLRSWTLGRQQLDTQISEVGLRGCSLQPVGTPLFFQVLMKNVDLVLKAQFRFQTEFFTTAPGAQSFAAVSLSSANLSAGSTLGRPPRAKDMAGSTSQVDGGVRDEKVCGRSSVGGRYLMLSAGFPGPGVTS